MWSLATALVRSPEVTPSADPSVPAMLTPASVTPPAAGTVAVPCPEFPTCVKLGIPTYPIFLMSTGVDVRADLVAAWSKGSQTQAQHRPCQVLHYNCSRAHEPLVLLDALDRIRDGYFDAVILIRPASSGSRVRHSSNGQAPLRSRSHPLGLSDLSAVGFAKLKQSNAGHRSRSLDRSTGAGMLTPPCGHALGSFPRTSVATPLKDPLPSGPSRTHVSWHSTKTCADWLSSDASSRTPRQPDRSAR